MDSDRTNLHSCQPNIERSTSSAFLSSLVHLSFSFCVFVKWLTSRDLEEGCSVWNTLPLREKSRGLRADVLAWEAERQRGWNWGTGGGGRDVGAGAKDRVRLRKVSYAEMEKKLLEGFERGQTQPDLGFYLHPFGCSAEETRRKRSSGDRGRSAGIQGRPVWAWVRSQPWRRKKRSDSGYTWKTHLTGFLDGTGDSEKDYQAWVQAWAGWNWIQSPAQTFWCNWSQRASAPVYSLKPHYGIIEFRKQATWQSFAGTASALPMPVIKRSFLLEGLQPVYNDDWRACLCL